MHSQRTPQYTIRTARPQDLVAVCELIRRRRGWLSERGIDQWKDYEDFFPTSYFSQRIADGELLVACNDSQEICAAVTQRKHDPYWTGREPAKALYLHNLVSAPQACGAGAVLLDSCEKNARTQGYDRLRLDCQADNAPLNAYYAARGFSSVGECLEGTYRGVLREKKLV